MSWGVLRSWWFVSPPPLSAKNLFNLQGLFGIKSQNLASKFMHLYKKGQAPPPFRGVTKVYIAQGKMSKMHLFLSFRLGFIEF